ncbi:hypothetical protein FDG2_4256 [Candidatus Protofrankia californiensis]|uniref:HTH gntR-type domain-containing protein n=1 Tax=Candidatus Protofrankia californiensis TaxID=1839754 RepID=A0A1C3P4E2_9ACTN|nr:hypothetical protein FDG2_4256 [Candidatus Protofrankia californiensis]
MTNPPDLPATLREFTQMPRWEIIARGLRLDIHDGTYPPGAALPSEADIATRYDCSRPTVRRAIAALVGEGLLTVAHGRGTFVRTDPDRYLIVIGTDDHPDYLHTAPHGWISLTSSSPEEPQTDLRIGLAIDEATRTEAITFDTRPGRLLIHRRAAWTHLKTNRHLFAHSAAPAAALTHDPNPESVLHLFDDIDRNNHPNPYYQALTGDDNHTTWDITITAAMPSPALGTYLGAPPGTPTLNIRRTLYDSQGHPLEHTTIHAPANHYELTTTEHARHTPTSRIHLRI